MYEKQTKVVNRTGLHARPASDFVLLAKKFESEVTIRRLDDQSEVVNAKSIMFVLAEGFSQGAEIIIAADGVDEQLAVDSLVALIDSGFGE